MKGDQRNRNSVTLDSTWAVQNFGDVLLIYGICLFKYSYILYYMIYVYVGYFCNIYIYTYIGL